MNQLSIAVMHVAVYNEKYNMTVCKHDVRYLSISHAWMDIGRGYNVPVYSLSCVLSRDFNSKCFISDCYDTVIKYIIMIIIR